MLETWEIMERAKVDAWVASAVQDIEGYLLSQGSPGLVGKRLALGCATLIQKSFETRGDMMNTVTITTEEYESLLADYRVLVALQNAGVDNWEGYDFAMGELDD